MTKSVRLRPHHLLCLRFFAGHGYNYSFVENVRRIIGEMEEEGTCVQIVDGCDEVCALCPYQADEVCRFARSVSAKDVAVSTFLGLTSKGAIPANELLALVDERIALLPTVRDVCGECEWSRLCDRQLERARSRPP